MIIKELSRKQDIILMNSNNTAKFMKDNLLYVANINRLLRNMKSEVLVDFIWSNQLSVTVVTYKVAS